MNHTLSKRVLSGMTVFLVGASLAGCGQKGPLYQVPDCSPVTPNGTIRTLTDDDGNTLPPCTVDAPADADAAFDENVTPLDNDLMIDETDD